MTKPYCPLLPKDLPEGSLDESLPWMDVSDACNDYNNLENLGGQQVVVDSAWKDLINSAGMPIYYFVYKFNIKRSDKIWGEDILAEYEEPFQIKAYVEVKDVPKILGPMGGFFADDTITAYIHIKTFNRKTKGMKVFEDLKLRYEPKPSDLIQIIEFGCDRPGGRGAKLFEVTNKEDELISQNLNMGFAHYVWKITAKRFQYSYQDGAITPFGEEKNCQVYDNNIQGTITDPSEIRDINTPSDKSYNWNIDKKSKEEIFNQNVNNQSNIYGGYYN
jgi:hypothetical protein